MRVTQNWENLGGDFITRNYRQFSWVVKSVNVSWGLWFQVES